MLADHGLRAPSGHVDYKGFERKLDYAHALGFEYVVCPMFGQEHVELTRWFQAAADQFKSLGREVTPVGNAFGFHKHNYEFRRFGDVSGFDTLVAQTDPKLCGLN